MVLLTHMSLRTADHLPPLVSDHRAPNTPYLELDIDIAIDRYAQLRVGLPNTGIHYAVKANPHPALLAALADSGCSFDVASPDEVRAALAAGATADQLLYSNPVKRADHIAEAAALGVSLFVADSLVEVRKIAVHAPRSALLCRLATSGAGSDWPLSRKYGCTAAEAVEVLCLAEGLGLEAAGVSFHVGSQQRSPAAWSEAIADAAEVFWAARSRGLHPWLLDLGGGFPARHQGSTPPLPDYTATIAGALLESFGEHQPRTVIEPGRGVVGDAGTVVTSVVEVVPRGGARWVFLDAGVFTGMVECLDEAIVYRLSSTATGPVGPCVLAGPTCDSADVLYERTPVDLPLSLRAGDVVRLHSAGAYTTCYSTVGFNGFAPMGTVVVGG